MESSNQTIEIPSTKSDEKDESSKVDGSYIQERKRNVEYLDLETEKALRTIRDQTSKEVTPSTSTDAPEPDASVGSADVSYNDNSLPPGEENIQNQSFDNEFSDMYSEEREDSSSKLKRTITQANFNNPENQFLTLDEIEELKKAKLEGSTTTKCSTTPKSSNTLSTGQFDTRGRPIPGLAKPPQDNQETSLKQPVTTSYNMEPQNAYQCTSMPQGIGSYIGGGKSESTGKIYVGGMPPSLSEAHLHVYFSQFGTVVNVALIRDRETGISKGFGFVTFAREEEAGNVVTMMGNHVIERRPVRVSFASTQGQSQNNKKGKNNSEILDAMHLPEQARLYMGPLEEDVIANDVTKQFCQFGTVQLVQRIRASETTVKKSFGYVDYHEGSSAVCRAFGTRAFVKGRHLNMSLSKFAMELLLSDTCIFFYEAFEYCDEQHLEQHFSQFGQVYRAIHIRNDPGSTNSNEYYPWKNYGFIDFVSYDSSVRALEMKTQLLHPGQYVRIGRTLPQSLLFDLMAISDKYGTEIKKRLESHKAHGTWGDSKYIYGNITTSQVRIPAGMIGKLMGERGKNIAEITRDSKVKINIPKIDQNIKHVVISITGQKENIKTAQYLMQKLLKGQK